MKKLMLMAAMVAMVLAAAAPAMADNTASVESTQVLQQTGGDQTAVATGTGEGDTAAANNQEFNATQVQQSAAIAGNGNAAAQNVGDGGAKAYAHPWHYGKGSGDNVATVESMQFLQQTGGDQMATATGTGGGDVAAANNQEFAATQVQQSLAIAGNGNAAAQNADVEPATTGGGSAPLIDQSETNGGFVVVEPGDTLASIAASLGTSVEALVALNGIENPDLIFPGQVLVF